MSNIRDDIISIIKETCHPVEIDLSDHDRSLLESGMDSLDFASVLMGIEEKFDVELPALDDIEKYGTINSIVTMLEQQT